MLGEECFDVAPDVVFACVIEGDFFAGAFDEDEQAVGADAEGDGFSHAVGREVEEGAEEGEQEEEVQGDEPEL